ncbi:MAG TPA: hypothetical protein VFP20_00070 [Bacteroidales bacterium]|nr:hypothetical protein [Bacteroidales bacterium]
MDKVTLYKKDLPNITISMELYFNEKGQLIFDGYDLGKLVEDALGDSDYEYDYAIEPIEVEKLYHLFQIQQGDRSGLLNAIKFRFEGDNAYSLFGEFMNEHQIDFESFSWV